MNNAYITEVKTKSPAVDVVTGLPLPTVMVNADVAEPPLVKTFSVWADMVCVVVVLVLLSMVTRIGATTVTLS